MYVCVYIYGHNWTYIYVYHKLSGRYGVHRPDKYQLSPRCSACLDSWIIHRYFLAYVWCSSWETAEAVLHADDSPPNSLLLKTKKWIYPLKMVIFNSYVNLPEGNIQHHSVRTTRKATTIQVCTANSECNEVSKTLHCNFIVPL